jgi:hypothetical protein
MPAAMPTRSTVNPWLQLATLFGLFVLDGLLGWALADWAAPGSGFATALSGLVLPAAYAVGCWRGAGSGCCSTRSGAARATARLAAAGWLPAPQG